MSSAIWCERLFGLVGVRLLHGLLHDRRFHRRIEILHVTAITNCLPELGLELFDAVRRLAVAVSDWYQLAQSKEKRRSGMCQLSVPLPESMNGIAPSQLSRDGLFTLLRLAGAPLFPAGDFLTLLHAANPPAGYNAGNPNGLLLCLRICPVHRILCQILLEILDRDTIFDRLSKRGFDSPYAYVYFAIWIANFVTLLSKLTSPSRERCHSRGHQPSVPRSEDLYGGAPADLVERFALLTIGLRHLWLLGCLAL
mmetsp:Transcript_49237/g.137933  ORF Transcript_49237/g.137933 Transcript_49237/m.137933 type:complete len:253 (+) Transcript_49237:169-927(+)